MYQENEKKIVMLDLRLIQWGYWYCKCVKSQAAGYPSKSTTVTALEGSRSTCPIYPKDNRLAEDVNNIILHLGALFPDRREVIIKEYTEEGAQIEKAKKMGLSRTGYRTLLELAKTWIHAKLN